MICTPEKSIRFVFPGPGCPLALCLAPARGSCRAQSAVAYLYPTRKSGGPVQGVRAVLLSFQGVPAIPSPFSGTGEPGSQKGLSMNGRSALVPGSPCKALLSLVGDIDPSCTCVSRPLVGTAPVIQISKNAKRFCRALEKCPADGETHCK